MADGKGPQRRHDGAAGPLGVAGHAHHLLLRFSVQGYGIMHGSGSFQRQVGRYEWAGCAAGQGGELGNVGEGLCSQLRVSKAG